MTKLQQIHHALQFSSACHQIDSYVCTKLTQATAKSYISEINGTTDKYLNAVRTNSLNGLRLSFPLTGVSVFNVANACYTANDYGCCSIIGKHVVVALPNLPILCAGQAIAALFAFAGIGAKPSFVKSNSFAITKIVGILCQYGVAGIVEFTALAGADHFYAEQHNLAANACMAVACLFAGFLEPIRAALALLVGVCNIPRAIAIAVLYPVIGLILAVRTTNRNQAAYTFGLGEVPELASVLAEQKHLADLAASTKSFFTELRYAGCQSNVLRVLKSYGTPEFTAKIDELAIALGKVNNYQTTAGVSAQVSSFGSELLCADDKTAKVGHQYRRQVLFLHPDRLSTEAEPVSECAMRLANAAFRALTHARDLFESSNSTQRKRSFTPRKAATTQTKRSVLLTFG